jgi:hypothetical protein
MLGTISVAPVSSIDDSKDLNVSVAKQMLFDTSREVQSAHYYFNTDRDYPLSINIDKEIPLPENALYVAPDPEYWRLRATPRGNMMYNGLNHNYKFEKCLTASITFFLEWDKLPQPAKQLIAIKAARKFQLRMLPDDYTSKFSQQEELEAKAQLEDYDAMTSEYNLADSNPVFQTLNRW